MAGVFVQAYHRPGLGRLLLAAVTVSLASLAADLVFAAEEAAARGTPTPERIVLAQDGKTEYCIVVASQAAAPVRFAAEELQKYLKKISGVELPIAHQCTTDRAIFVSQGQSLPKELADLRTELAGRGEDGYLTRTVGPRLALAGNSPRATLYAVYHFLEKRLGCGWCAPDDDTVPRLNVVQVAAFDEAVGPPAFSMRQIIVFPYGGALLKKNNLPHNDWLAKNRFNWSHPAPNGPYFWERNQSRKVFTPEVKRRGLYLEVGGHTFNTWIPADRYAASHPEFFAMKKDSTRATDGTDVSRGGLCITNPDVVKTVADNMIGWLDENPEVDAVDLWHNDSYLYCHCPQCTPPATANSAAEVGYTRSYVKFCNQVAGLVAKRHPKVLINALSYAHTTVCPSGVDRLDDQVLLGLCLFPRPSQRTMCPLETSTQKLDEKLRAQLLLWPKVAKNFYVYEYYTIGQSLKRWSMVSMIREDLRYFRRLGIQGVSSDQWGPGWYPLNMYAFGRLMWNPDLTCEEIVQEFCGKYYGRAAGTMAAYWNALEEGLRESWTTTTAIDWRDAKRLELLKQALIEAKDQQIEVRIRSTAAMHQLKLS